MKKLRVAIDGKESVLEIAGEAYVLTGALDQRGTASLARIGDETVSVLVEGRSYTVRVLKSATSTLEAWIGNRRYAIEVSDLRDRPAGRSKQSLAGPLELRALMPGKVVKLLVEPGTKVESGQSLIVVEAMKMQNEMKSSKEGVVTKIFVAEGATVAAGERLMVVE
ncbi:MAG TPA: biotin/lipoyl-containing protein [Bryobacteraceae bacterium]|jgi:biotin carboxyl carrier protein|nr:biotin/lipoyl-containing protein [Bryobacteraceae bacterium]